MQNWLTNAIRKTQEMRWDGAKVIVDILNLCTRAIDNGTITICLIIVIETTEFQAVERRIAKDLEQLRCGIIPEERSKLRKLLHATCPEKYSKLCEELRAIRQDDCTLTLVCSDSIELTLHSKWICH